MAAAKKEKEDKGKVTDSGVTVKKAVEGDIEKGMAITDEDFEKAEKEGVDPFSLRPGAIKPQTLEDITELDPSKEDESDDGKKSPEDGRAEKAGEEEDGETESKEKEGKQVMEPAKKEPDKGDNEKELKSQLTRTTQENALLREQLVNAIGSSGEVTKLQAQLDRIKPFMPMIEGMNDVKELAAKVEVPENEMHGEDEDGNKFATEADRRRILQSSEQGIAMLVQRAVERDRVSVNEVTRKQQTEAQGLLKDLQHSYNEGKKFDQKTLEEIAMALGDRVGILNDPKIDKVTKKLVLEGAYLKAREKMKDEKVIEKTPEEIEEDIKKANEREEKAKLIKSRSNLRPSKELSPVQKAHVKAWEGMGKVVDVGRLPLSGK